MNFGLNLNLLDVSSCDNVNDGVPSELSFNCVPRTAHRDKM